MRGAIISRSNQLHDSALRPSARHHQPGSLCCVARCAAPQPHLQPMRHSRQGPQRVIRGRASRQTLRRHHQCCLHLGQPCCACLAVPACLDAPCSQACRRRQATSCAPPSARDESTVMQRLCASAWPAWLGAGVHAGVLAPVAACCYMAVTVHGDLCPAASVGLACCRRSAQGAGSMEGLAAHRWSQWRWPGRAGLCCRGSGRRSHGVPPGCERMMSMRSGGMHAAVLSWPCCCCHNGSCLQSGIGLDSPSRVS